MYRRIFQAYKAAINWLFPLPPQAEPQANPNHTNLLSNVAALRALSQSIETRIERIEQLLTKDPSKPTVYVASCGCRTESES